VLRVAIRNVLPDKVDRLRDWMLEVDGPRRREAMVESRRVSSPGEKARGAPPSSVAPAFGRLQYRGIVAERAAVEGMTDEECLRRLHTAAEDEQEGRLVRCSTPEEIRRVIDTARKTGR